MAHFQKDFDECMDKSYNENLYKVEKNRNRVLSQYKKLGRLETQDFNIAPSRGQERDNSRNDRSQGRD